MLKTSAGSFLIACAGVFLAIGCGGGSTQAPAPVPVPVSPTGIIVTHHNDNQRTGQNLHETLLTPANVNSTGFGKVFSYPVDGAIYGEPLYVANLDIQGVRNVVYIVTEHDSVYAFDADNEAPGLLWHIGFVDPTGNITSVPCADEPSACTFMGTEIGISSTPVIDVATKTLYVCAFTKENGSYFHRLHALDLATGSEKFEGPVPVQGSVAGSGDDTDGTNIAFNPHNHLQRSALLLANGIVYLAFASFDDTHPYHGWLFGYDAQTLQQRSIFNATPNGGAGGIWQSGGGPAGDNSGNIYIVTGNGTFDANNAGQDFGDSFLKLTPATGSLPVASFFTPFNQSGLNVLDLDVGAGGPLLLPDQPGIHPHLMMSGGKRGILCLVDRDNMGGFRAADDSQIVQSLSIPRPVFSTPAFWENKVYLGASGDPLKIFPLSAGMLSPAPSSNSAATFGFPGVTPSISANGSQAGIVWVIENAAFRSGKPAILHAFDANDVSVELYNSKQAGARDTLPNGVGFGVPAVANGKVYVGTLTELDVFGILPPQTP
jgi:hypothetical protein